MTFFDKLSQITFASPWLLLFLLAIPLIAFLKGRKGDAPAVSFSSTATLRTLGISAKSRAGAFLNSLLYLALAALIIGLARPQLGKTVSEVHASGIDIMVALDVSGSMLTQDYHIGGQRASRLDAIKQVTKKFIESRPSDRIGIVAFASAPYLVSPLTLDHGWLLKNLERVKIGVVGAQATAIGSAMTAGANRLEGQKNSKSRVLILLTDGQNNAGEVNPDTAAEAIKALGIHFYAIGAGTNSIAPTPVAKNSYGGYIYQNTQVHYDAAGLQKIAKLADGHYFRASDLKALKNIYSQIDKLEKTTFQVKQTREYHDWFPWLIGAGIALLLLQILLSQTVWRKLP